MRRFIRIFLYHFITLSIHIVRFCRFEIPSLKYGKPRTAAFHTTPCLSCSVQTPVHHHIRNRPVFSPPLENECRREKNGSPKNLVVRFDVFLLVRSVCGKCFLGVTPSSIPFYCLDFAQTVRSLFGNRLERSKVRNTWQSVLPPSMKATTKASLQLFQRSASSQL